MRYIRVYFLPLLFLAAPVAAQQREDQRPVEPASDEVSFELFSGVEFQQVELDDGQDAEKLSIPFAARLTKGPLRLTAQAPYLRVTAPGNVVVPGGPLGLPILVDPSKPAQVSTREGIGDLRVGLAYQLPVSGVSASVNGGAKIPTASAEKGLGTGETDYWLGADLSTRVGAVTPFAGANYTKNGDPAGFELKDTLAGHAGAALSLSDATSAHLGYSFEENASADALDEQRIFGGVNTRLGSTLSLGLYGSAGVNGPADVGAGVSLGVRLK